MRDFKADLVRAYDNDAPARRARGLQEGREGLRDRFVSLLNAEGRSRVVEFGAGVGHDAAGFLAAGFEIAAMDLSPENVAACRAMGIDARVGDFYDLDFPLASFDAGWAMSTLLHVPNSDIDHVLEEMVCILKPGAPLGIGLWGGIEHEGVFEDDWATPKRFFSFRSDDRLREILERHLTIEHFETLMHNDADHYQFCIGRTPVLA